MNTVQYLSHSSYCKKGHSFSLKKCLHIAVKKVQIEYDIILSPSGVMVLLLLSKMCMPQPESNGVDIVM